mmetsp:Transcript_81126/g.210745  ORF Transcript_81126/g.210745 Transcript_81126/m.210745 type:complete len:231 (+) Transcript_81126:141-833(+)
MVVTHAMPNRNTFPSPTQREHSSPGISGLLQHRAIGVMPLCPRPVQWLQRPRAHLLSSDKLRGCLAAEYSMSAPPPIRNARRMLILVSTDATGHLALPPCAEDPIDLRRARLLHAAPGITRVQGFGAARVMAQMFPRGQAIACNLTLFPRAEDPIALRSARLLHAAPSIIGVQGFGALRVMAQMFPRGHAIARTARVRNTLGGKRVLKAVLRLGCVAGHGGILHLGHVVD